MLNLDVERIGKLAVVHCEGRIVRSDAAFRLRDTVMQHQDADVIMLDLSGVEVLEGGGLGMLLYLQLWARDRGIQLKVLDPPAGVRLSLDRTRAAVDIEIAGMGEALSLLAPPPEELWDSSRSAA